MDKIKCFLGFASNSSEVPQVLKLVVIVELGNWASYTILFSILQNIF